MLDCDQWMKGALAAFASMLPMAREPMRLATNDQDWLAWRETGQRGIYASGKQLSVQHTMRLTLSCLEATDHQRLMVDILTALQQADGCVYARLSGDSWDETIRRRECVLYLAILEAV